MLRVYSVISDIHDQKLAAERLRASEERFRVVFENAGMGIALSTLPGQMLLCNGALARMLGYLPEELRGATYQSITHPEDLDRQRPFADRLLAGELSGYTIEKRYIRRDGGVIWAHATVTLVRNEAGEPEFAVAMMENITERKAAEAKIREQAMLLDKAADAILVTDLEDRLIYFNQSAARTYQLGGAVQGQRLGELLGIDPGAYQQARQQVRELGDWRGEFGSQAGGGQQATRAHWTLVCDEAGSARRIMMVHTDVTEWKALEAQFLRAQRMESIGTLATGIAHDLNNVLTPILMSVYMLREQTREPAALSLLGRVESSAQRGAAIIKQLLTFGRGAQGARVIIQPRHVIREVAKIAQETFPKSIRISSRLQSDLWTIEGDPTQLHQVLLNLCVNARDAMPEGGKLSLQAENAVLDDVYVKMHAEARPGNHVVITVSDTGSGIAPEMLERVFDPFFTTKPVGQGTGLGLSTALGIVKSHHGFFQVRSSIGVGSEFRIFLPASADGRVAQAPELDAEIPQGNGALILVADDEETIREIVGATLERAGYRVLKAADGASAVALFAVHHASIAAVVTDIAMPTMDGVAAARVLKRIRADVPVVFIGGIGLDPDEPAMLPGFARAVLMKPFTGTELLHTVGRAIQASGG